MTRRRHHGSGFTLLELIAAMAIGVLLLSLCLVTTGGVIGACGAAEDHAGVERGARLALQQLVDDLSLAIRDAGVFHEPGGDDWRSDRIGIHCLLPSARQSADDAVGDLCAVMYGCREMVVAGRAERCLTRTVCGSRHVYRAIAQGRPEELWRQQPVADDLVATGVVSFKVKRMIRGHSGKWRAWTEEDGELVDGVEIGLVMVEPDVLKRMGDVGDANPLGWPDSLSAAERRPGFRVYRALLVVGRHENE